MAAVFYETKEQKRLAEKSLAAWSAKGKAAGKGTIVTKILPASVFYRAEDYHQKYRLRGRSELMKVFKEIFPLDRDFVDSTMAARLNGMLAGRGSIESLKNEMNAEDALPGAAQQLEKLLRAVERRR